MNERVKAIKENTEALQMATFGLGKWEKKDEKYHNNHHKILTGIDKKLQTIIKILEKK